MFLITMAENEDISYELIELDFITSVRQLKYTYQNNVLLLGSDQVIYTIPQIQTGEVRIYPVFNQ